MRKWMLIIGSVIAGVAAFVFLSGSGADMEGGGFGIPLARAAVSANFLEEEAGISAYFKAPSTISLAAARDAYVVIERDEPDYLLGWVAPQDGGTGEFNVRVYTASNGWVVAYYLRGEAASKIVDLSTFSGGVFDTRLEQALRRVAIAAGASLGKVGYYHYGYPTADALMTIVGVEGKAFTFTIPSALSVSEVSWWVEGFRTSRFGSIAGGDGTTISLRGTPIASTSQDQRFRYGEIAASIPRNVPADVTLSGSFGSDAIVIVYGQ